MIFFIYLLCVFSIQFVEFLSGFIHALGGVSTFAYELNFFNRILQFILIIVQWPDEREYC